MTPTATSAASRPRFRQQEAALVAGLLRMSRLTVLYGERGAGKTTLLKRSVLPLLGRRSDDRYGGRRPRGVVVPFPDRRRLRDRPAEIAFYFDSWSEAPLLEMQTRIASALILRRLQVSPPFPPLAESLAAWSVQLGVRFLFIFDHFETLSGVQRARPGVREFEDALVALVNSTSAANVLVSGCDEHVEALARLRDRIPGFGDASVRLPALAHDMPGEREVARQTPIVPIKPTNATEAALATLREWEATTHLPHATTAQALDVLRAWAPGRATGARIEAPTDGRDLVPPTTTLEGLGESGKVECAPPIAADSEALSPAQSPEAGPASPPAARGPATLRLALVVAGVAISLVATRLMGPAPAMTGDRSIAEPRAVSVSPVSPPAAVEPDRTTLAIAVDAGNATDAAIVADLGRLAAGASFRVAASRGSATLSTSAPMAIMSFDRLRPPAGSRRAAGSGGDAFAIVTPLYIEEVHAIVRRDSPLRFLHELRGARINVGPPGNGGRPTALRLYARMFNSPLPPHALVELPHDEALARLVSDRTLEALLVVEAQPVRWLAELAPDVASSIRLLSADASDAATARAVEDYLPARVRAANYRWLDGDVASLATMAFLVVDPASADGERQMIAELAGALCERLPELRATGHPKWREVQPGLRLEGGWSLWPPAQLAFDACMLGAAAVPTTMTSKGAPR